MKWISFLIVLFSGYAWCTVTSAINRVRVVDHTSYVINVITKTMNLVEKNGWSNLKLPDYTKDLNETVLTEHILGKLKYTNGFVTSIQHVDIQQSTVQQVWQNANTGVILSLRGTLRMHDVAVGYDVISDIEGKSNERPYTAIYVHPLVTFAFFINREMNTDHIAVTVTGNVPRTTRLAEFRPKDANSDIFTSTFDPTATTSDGILAWGSQVFEPITYKLVTEEIEFPEICYDCPV